ncbi:helix-turn-helix domain-containing protein [Bradyrhizobium sp. KB893862 SZCCT0404]|uniref:helix-turn-helix domain-containing protein n=1 Tax=Bradyrhizobium sp. KB893862 SZCCT0404 TaxID=2807672 RepID=UPI001BADF973|nr:helix-turn-helix domain-containing protein [Bradyrhizobium sp. KB893862 SZCCT0404]MBR1177208.1 helix-turn-helix domain-containing protein [Bradyrhizobium sp. KB893862 SZCCT0404]
MQEKALAPYVVELRSRDAAEHAGGLAGWRLQIEQFSAGCFCGQLTVLQLDHVQVVRERTSQALIKRGTAGAGALVFGLPIAASGHSHFNGHVLPFPFPMVNDGADLPLLVTPRYLDVAYLVVDRRWLADHFAGIGDRRLADALGALQHNYFKLPSERLAAMRYVFGDVFNACSRTNVIDFAQSRNELQSTLLQLVAEVLTSELNISITRVTPQRTIADRALAYALSRRENPPSVDDLCRQIGVSRRNLQDCFRDAFGFSPTHFLRVARLNAVRRELKTIAATGQRVSIGDVAASWGFWHLSRFAGNYRELFGELPSQTL